MEYLALSVLGENKPELACEVTRAITQAECNILDCHVHTIGVEFAATFLVAGTWNAIAKLETQLKQMQKKFGLHFMHQRTKPRDYQGQFLPYLIYIVAPDKQGITYEVTKFLTELGILIESLYCEVYSARYAHSRMLTINVSISVPETLAISELRERFFLICDHYNLDGILEPDKSQ